jgi:hypothetical protein
VEFGNFPVLQCLCGTAQRTFGDVAGYPETILLVECGLPRKCNRMTNIVLPKFDPADELTD